ncbi:hypothetical protein CJI54_04655 [Bifidobacteriaceae bacterium NR026]|nr:hypothetical protein CJI54_04655 [Bifidobacteriaceae bacterium NR026]
MLIWLGLGLRWFVGMRCAILSSVKILTQHAFCDSSQSPANLQRLATLWVAVC